MLLLTLLVGLFFPQSHASFDLSPIIITIAPSGPMASGAVTITNLDDSRTPVQLSIFHRDPDEDGKEDFKGMKDAGDLFQIFPSQVILGPKEKRAVRITYVGDPKMKAEMPFRVIAEEFPINVSDPKKVTNKAVASISIATRYIGSLYVTPAGAKPELVIEASPTTGTKTTEMNLLIQNIGTTHQTMKQVKLLVKSMNGTAEAELNNEGLAGVNGQNILAGRKRRFVIPWPKNIPVGPVKVTAVAAKS